MKMTLDLPNALVRQVQLHALHDGQNLKDAVADLLRKGLAAANDAESTLGRPKIAEDKKTGLPVIRCKPPASPNKELMPERVAEILLTQEAIWHNEAS